MNLVTAESVVKKRKSKSGLEAGREGVFFRCWLDCELGGLGEDAELWADFMAEFMLEFAAEF